MLVFSMDDPEAALQEVREFAQNQSREQERIIIVVGDEKSFYNTTTLAKWLFSSENPVAAFSCGKEIELDVLWE